MPHQSRLLTHQVGCRRPIECGFDGPCDALVAQTSGSFYYRFPSRDVLLAELWLATALAFQQGFVAAIKAGDGLTAALHTPIWVRAHLDDARVFLLHDSHS